jgi:hypothetical protein
MPKSKQESVLACAPDLGALRSFIDLLNTEDYWSASLLEGKKKIGGDYRMVQMKLRQFVQAWLNSGPNVNRLFDADPMLDQAARNFQPHFIPTKGGTAKLAYLKAPEYLSGVAPLEIALGLFLPFLLNPFNEKLGGPCKNCDGYYLRETDRKKSVYCSERCGHCLTSSLANKTRRDREHQRRLRLAEQWTQKWLNTKTADPWKKWVSGRSSIKKHWLTRAVNKGQLVEPLKQA